MSEPTPKKSLQVHAANEKIARVKGLAISRLPDHEGGSWYMSLDDATTFIRAQHLNALIAAARHLVDVAEDTDLDEVRQACARVDAILTVIDAAP
jgi:hypothetical protein